MKRLSFDVDRQDDDTPDVGRPMGPSRCAAHGCRFAGSIGDSSHASSWWCAHHYGAEDLVAVTQAMARHRGLVDIVIDGRIASNRASGREIGSIWLGLRARLDRRGYPQPKARDGSALPTFAGWLAALEVDLGNLLRPVGGPRAQKPASSMRRAAELLEPAA